MFSDDASLPSDSFWLSSLQHSTARRNLMMIFLKAMISKNVRSVDDRSSNTQIGICNNETDSELRRTSARQR
jgi:hypothetical protein